MSRSAMGRAVGPAATSGTRLALTLSFAAHGALVAIALSLPQYRSAREPDAMVMVDVVADVAPAVVEPPSPPVPHFSHPVPVPARTVSLQRASPATPAPVAPPASPTQRPAPDEATAAAAPIATLASDSAAGDAPAVLAAIGPAPTTRGGSGRPGGDATLAPFSGGTLSEGQRRSLIDGYHRDLLRRINARKRYPDEARDLELTGVVLVQVTIDGGGRLVSARLNGPCPHLLLCDDAIRTVRAAGPFSSPPRVLGDSLQIEVPLEYSLE